MTAPHSPLRARPLTVKDWDWLSQWAKDPAVDRELGPVDTEWLDHVLHTDDGVELVVDDEDSRPAAVMGCAWDPEGISHGLTDIAVDPARRGLGLGRQALAAAMSWPGHPPASRWIAFVSPENEAALLFFRSIGWRDEGMDDGMLRFSCSAPLS